MIRDRWAVLNCVVAGAIGLAVGCGGDDEPGTSSPDGAAGDGSAGTGGGDTGTGASDTGTGASDTGTGGSLTGGSAGSGTGGALPPPPPVTGSLACADGYRSGDETGHDCGGSCENQDCCTNGYADVALGETGVDCGGTCGDCVAVTYFVSNGGDDAAAGTSPDTAWQTIDRVNNQALQPGDAVLLERGGTWRESLSISHSGSADAPITFGAYGTGEKPQILGSERVTGWTEVQANVWQSGNTLAAPREREGHSVTNHPASLFFGETSGSVTWGTMENLHLNGEGAPTDIYVCDSEGAPFSLLDQEYDWCWQDDHVYVYSPEDPGSRYAFVEVPQRMASISMANHPPAEHIVIDGLELLFAVKYGFDDGWPMNVQVRGLTVQNCHIGWMGTKGAASAMGLQIWHSDMLVHNNDIHDCGRRNISYNVYGDVRDAPVVFENVVFQHNTLHNGYHTTGFDISCGFTDTFQNFVFRNNFIWDDPADDPEASPNDFTSMGFFLNADAATFTGFQVYGNVLSHTKQKGITINGLVDSAVFNNTLYGMNVRAGGSGYRGMITVSGDVQNLRIEGNIFHGNVTRDQYVLQGVAFSDSSDAGTTMNRNLFFHEDESQYMVSIASSGNSYAMADWAEYQADTGWGADSPAPADPLFVDAAANDFSLQAASPAIDAAAAEPTRTTDCAGNPVDDAPDIGAFEYQAP